MTTKFTPATNLAKVNLAIAAFQNCNVADVPECFSILSKEISLASKQEQNEKVEELFRWTFENSSEQPIKFCYASCLRALDLFLNEKHEPALQLIIETKKQFEELNDRIGSGCCLILMGCIYHTLGNLDLAMKNMLEGNRELQPEQCPHVLLAGYQYLGLIYFERGLINEAIHYFKDTFELAEKTQDPIWINYALQGLGKIYLQQKKYPESKKCLEEALNHAEENKNSLGISNSLTELAKFHSETGNFTEAEKLHNEALVIREQNGFIAGAITNYIQLAEISISLSKQGEALTILLKGLQLAEQIKVKPKIYQIHSLLSKIYESNKDFEKCLIHQKLFHEIREQAELEDNARKLKNVQIIFETEQTQKENSIIRRQKAEIERKNIKLQETIDELTLAKVSKKARAITFGIAIVLFVMEDSILHFALDIVSTDNYFISLFVKIVIIFSLSPINKAIEQRLLKKVIKTRKLNKDGSYPETEAETFVA